MSTVTVSQKEYREPVDKKLRYDYLHEVMKSDIFSTPPVRSRNAVIKAMMDTGKHGAKFLKSLSKGLKRSSYFK